MAAPKKDATTRARRNTASTASKLADGPAVIVPMLPTRPDEYSEQLETYISVPWNAETLSWWADLWASPMAAEYHSADRHQLFLLAVLMDDFWRAPSTKLAAEIRLQRVAFGLTPYDRRRLEWTIETAEESKDRGQVRKDRQQRPASKGPDPRAVLTAVN
ncbi:hypothetical protein [Cryobacterium cryoconiti]|uniref:Uncharacterized protein n=1 Tax=Cryobacterium cryoconiti TaxID=1259239 RepID=A0A4Y8JSL4_9MICO|nr:hypothetical protein [Cryobacterium cryoconiti]TFD27510.1 hypothetical protein E3T49_13290 [Cryobacterium cryoconiti]